MEPPRVRKPDKRDNLTEVLPEDLDKGTLYLIESYDNWAAPYRYKGIFLGNTTIGASDPPLIKSFFRIKEYPQELVGLLGDARIGVTEGFRNIVTRYYLAKAQNIIDGKVFAKMINAQKFNPTEEDLQNPKNDVGKELAKYFYEPEPKGTKGGTKRKTKRTKRAKKGGTKTKRTKRAKKGGTKTKRTT